MLVSAEPDRKIKHLGIYKVDMKKKNPKMVSTLCTESTYVAGKAVLCAKVLTWLAGIE